MFFFWLPTTLNSLSCPANYSLHRHSLRQPYRELAISDKVTPYQRRRTSVIAGVFGYFHLTAASASAGMTPRHTWYRAIWPRVRHIKQQIKVSFLWPENLHTQAAWEVGPQYSWLYDVTRFNRTQIRSLACLVTLLMLLFLLNFLDLSKLLHEFLLVVAWTF